MRTISYAILGLICRQPMTGYDITKEFNSNDLSNFWYAKHSQVYPELGMLVDEGYLNFEIVIQGEKMEKKLYTITDAGKKVLSAWLEEDEPLPSTPKDVFRLRTYFSDLMSDTVLHKQLHSDKAKHIAKRDMLQQIMDTHYSEVPAQHTKELGDYMVLEGAILRESSYIEWLEHCLKYTS